MMIKIVANFYLKPENVEAAIELAKELVTETRQEKGCAQYDLAQSPESPEKIVVLESWETQADLDAHSASEHFTRIVPAIAAMCDQPPVLNSYIQLI
ncbi:MAG: putative quinol monooxygenase [Raoultibacter sp.]|jgi:quinol monooxygenase YgiN